MGLIVLSDKREERTNLTGLFESRAKLSGVEKIFWSKSSTRGMISKNLSAVQQCA
jgi:hypothetical protein